MARGRGSVRLKREPNYWEVRAYAGTDPATGRPRYVSRTVRGGRRDADKLLAQLVSKVDAEGPASSHTVAEMVEAHIDHLEVAGREFRTIEGYRSIARMLAKDRLAKMPLHRVTPKSIDDYYVRLSKSGRSPSTVRRYHAVLRSAFKRAVAWGWIPSNPVVSATPPSMPRVGRRIPRPDVVAALINEAMESRNEDNGMAIRLLAATGARRGEICGLRWTEVDFDRSVIQIRSAIAQRKDGVLIEKEPKTHQQREVAIDARTAELLRTHREEQDRLIGIAGETPSPTGYVLADLVADATGEAPTPPNRLTQAFRRLTERVPGSENMRLHDLRHWYASTQLDAGEPLPAVAARIGDHVETLAKVYAHKGHRGDHDAAETISGLLGDSD